MSRVRLRIACVIVLLALLIAAFAFGRVDRSASLETPWTGEAPTAWIGDGPWASITIRYTHRRVLKRGTPFPTTGRAFDHLRVIAIRPDASKSVFSDPPALRTAAIARLQEAAGDTPHVRTMPADLHERDRIRILNLAWGLALNTLFLILLIALLCSLVRPRHPSSE